MGEQNHIRELTSQEIKVVKLTTELWNEFCRLELNSPQEQQDMRFYIDAIHSIVLSRPTADWYNSQEL